MAVTWNCEFGNGPTKHHLDFWSLEESQRAARVSGKRGWYPTRDVQVHLLGGCWLDCMVASHSGKEVEAMTCSVGRWLSLFGLWPTGLFRR